MELGIITELRKKNLLLEQELRQKEIIIKQLKALVESLENNINIELSKLGL